jgi:hypothetical protein
MSFFHDTPGNPPKNSMIDGVDASRMMLDATSEPVSGEGSGMRTTLTIDDDVLRAARQLAESTGESIGQTISRLARAALDKRPTGDAYRNGVKLLPVRPGAPGATLAEVNRLRDELP